MVGDCSHRRFLQQGGEATLLGKLAASRLQAKEGSMLFLVISEPRAERPSEARQGRQAYWRWLDERLADGAVVSAYPKSGAGWLSSST
jgi:hypothetical protein